MPQDLFTIEQNPDGSFWRGDKFWLFHQDAHGRTLIGSFATLTGAEVERDQCMKRVRVWRREGRAEQRGTPMSSKGL